MAGCTNCTKTRITNNNNPYQNNVRSTPRQVATTSGGTVKVQKITFGSKK